MRNDDLQAVFDRMLPERHVRRLHGLVRTPFYRDAVIRLGPTYLQDATRREKLRMWFWRRVR